MNTAITKLTIRTQLPLVDTTEKIVPPDEVVYLWDRIIIAVVLVGLLFGGMGFGVWRWMQQPESPSESIATQAVEEQASAELATSQPVEVQENSTASAEISEAEVVAPPPVVPSPVVKREPQSADSNEKAAAVAVSNPATPSSATGKVKILSNNVTRAYLSRSMTQPDPLPVSPTVFTLSEKGLVKVYFMTELSNLKGRVITYRWYLGKKLMATVRSKPISDPAKTFSSKFIDKGMLGQWRVELNTEDGTTLARADFEVR